MGFFDRRGPLYNPTLQYLPPLRRKVFISYHHADEAEVAAFKQSFHDGAATFISRGIGAEMAGDVIDSQDADYVMRCIREDHLHDSTVTIVMIGDGTWTRRYVDWELQASLRSGQCAPNGVLGIVLPRPYQVRCPERLRINLPVDGNDAYSRIYRMPTDATQLRAFIEDAFDARTSRRHLIQNPRDRMRYNKGRV